MNKLVEALKAIDRLYGDTTVPIEDIRDDLRELQEHINMLLDASEK